MGVIEVGNTLEGQEFHGGALARRSNSPASAHVRAGPDKTWVGPLSRIWAHPTPMPTQARAIGDCTGPVGTAQLHFCGLGPSHTGAIFISGKKL